VSKEKPAGAEGASKDAAGVSRDPAGVSRDAKGTAGHDQAPVKEQGQKAAQQKGEKAPSPPRNAAEGAPRAGKAPKGDKQAKGQKGPRQGAEGGGEGKAKAKPVADPPGYKPRLKALFLETVAKDLKEEFSYKSPMQIPRVSKIIVSMGLGEAIVNKKLLDSATQEMMQITGRKAVRTKAKKSIATFKVRKDMEIGAMVTLRGNVMYEFLDRLVNVAMPRIKDFRGANPNAFDGHGNYSLGVTEQIIFPEIDYDKIERVSGMNIAVVTTAKTDQEARSLLGRLGMPFRK
jgi:large subunit ribosomal protein L5